MSTFFGALEQASQERARSEVMARSETANDWVLALAEGCPLVVHAAYLFRDGAGRSRVVHTDGLGQMATYPELHVLTANSGAATGRSHSRPTSTGVQRAMKSRTARCRSWSVAIPRCSSGCGRTS